MIANDLTLGPFWAFEGFVPKDVDGNFFLESRCTLCARGFGLTGS